MNKEDTKGEGVATYIVELKKVNPVDKAKDLQKIKTTEEKFRNVYILDQSVLLPVSVFDEIVLDKGEEKLDDKKEDSK